MNNPNKGIQQIPQVQHTCTCTVHNCQKFVYNNAFNFNNFPNQYGHPNVQNITTYNNMDYIENRFDQQY